MESIAAMKIGLLQTFTTDAPQQREITKWKSVPNCTWHGFGSYSTFTLPTLHLEHDFQKVCQLALNVKILLLRSVPVITSWMSLSAIFVWTLHRSDIAFQFKINERYGRINLLEREQDGISVVYLAGEHAVDLEILSAEWEHLSSTQTIFPG